MRFPLLLVKFSIIVVLSNAAVFAQDRIAFLTEQLKLKALPTKVVAAIPELYHLPRSN